MNILKNVPEGIRDQVRAVMEDNVLDYKDKFSVLKDLISDPDVLVELLNHLKQNEVEVAEEAEEPGVTEDDFLALVTDQKKRLMNMMLQKKDFVTLEKLVARESPEAQRAFEKWRNGKAKITPTPKSSEASSSERISVRSSTRRSKPVNPPQPLQSESESDTDSFAKISSSISETHLEDGSEEEVEELRDEDTIPTSIPQIDADFIDQFPDCLNILILGETGVGKSTFINGLINYLKYGSIDEAHRNKVEILIKTYFTHTDEDYNRMEVVCDPTIAMERGGEAENENTVYGQSSTQSPKSYVFSWGPQGSQKTIRIIDTPGVGDVRGTEQEKLNFSKILSFIADFSEIHAICILLKPNESKLTLTFRYCINELLTHLHVSASRNILFCFTNSRQTLYRPGDTLPTLEAHLKDLQTKRGIEIPLDSSTMFCFDNESFRFLCALREGARFEPNDIQNFNGSWVKTVEETFRLFKRISELPVHNVNDTLSVNNIRAVILALARPLAEIARNQLLNVKLIEDKLREVEDYVKNGKDLEGRLYVDQVKILAKEIDYPMTVCTSKSCVDYMRFSSNPNAAMETVYKTECHPHCYLQGVQVSICPNTDLQHCWAMSNDVNKCRICSCPWSTHMHIRYKLEKTMEKTVDPTVKDSIKNRDDQIKTAKLFVEKESKRKEALQEEADKISKSCVEFAAFLRKNSILPYNDVYKEYVEHLIKEEKDKVSQGGSDKLLKQLECYRDEYEQQVRILESHGKKSTSNKTINQIYNMVEDLKKMKNCGSILAEIQKLELLSVRDQQTTKQTAVDLSSGWFGQMSGRGRRSVNSTMNSTAKKVRGFFSRGGRKN